MGQPNTSSISTSFELNLDNVPGRFAHCAHFKPEHNFRVEKLFYLFSSDRNVFRCEVPSL